MSEGFSSKVSLAEPEQEKQPAQKLVFEEFTAPAIHVVEVPDSSGQQETHGAIDSDSDDDSPGPLGDDKLESIRPGESISPRRTTPPEQLSDSESVDSETFQPPANQQCHQDRNTKNRSLGLPHSSGSVSENLRRLSKVLRVLGRVVRNITLFCAGLVLSITICLSVWGRQIVDFADAELSKDPYTAVPIKKMAEPLFGQHRAAYAEVLLWMGAIHVPGWLDSDPQRLALYGSRRYKEELHQAGLQNSPLYAYVFVKNAGKEAEFHSVPQITVRNDLLQSIQYASRLVGPKNRLTAAASRQAAAYLLSLRQITSADENTIEKLIRTAEDIDYNAKIQDEHAILECKRLRAALLVRQRNPEADQLWTEASQLAGWLEGENSLSHASLLLDRALYLASMNEAAKSIEPAQRCVNILLSGNHKQESGGLKSLVAGGTPITEVVVHYLSQVRSAELSTRERTTFETLEASFIGWCQANDSHQNHFNLLVDIADKYQSAGRYKIADNYYKKALKSVVTSKPSQFGKMNALNPSIRKSNWFVLTMAKTASNLLKEGNTDEAATIASNCIELMSPYSNWWSTSDYSSALNELIYSFGPLNGQTSTPSVRNVINSLTTMLNQQEFGRGKPFKLSAQYLAELYELQGNLVQAEHYYQTAAEAKPQPKTMAGLATFYCKTGKYDLAGPLFQLAEAEMKEGYELLHSTKAVGTWLCDARLKRLIDCTPDPSVFERCEWWNRFNHSIKTARTSYELGTAFSVIDLRPLITDFRKNHSGMGVAYIVKDLRRELRTLSPEKIKVARALLCWFDDCFPKNIEREQQCFTVLKDKLPLIPVQGSLSRPRTPCGLVPSSIFIISEADRDKMTKLLGGRKVMNQYRLNND